MSRKRSNRPHGHTRKRTRPSGQPGVPDRHGLRVEGGGVRDLDARESELMRNVAQAVESSDPLSLLHLISSLQSFDDRSPSMSGEDDETGLPPFDELIESFAEVSIPETSAILAVAAAVTDDELVRARIRRELVERGHRLPGWIRQLTFTVTGVEWVTEPFGDSDDIAVGVRLGSGHEFTLIVLVDHQAGSVVKDAFVSEQPLTSTLLAMRETEGADALTFTAMDRADARAKLAEALEHGLMLWPPFETETWPAARPLMRWVLAAMPDGGAGWGRPEWSEDHRARLVDDFLASAPGKAVEGHDTRDIVDTLIGLGSDYGPGDPLRWSTRSLEILLLDRIPRKIVADQAYLDSVPTVLRAFIPYVHERSGIDEGATSDSLAALTAFEPEYRTLIRTPRRQGPEALLGQMGVLGPLEPGDFDDFDDFDIDDYMLDSLGDEVGGRDVLAGLDATPLPDEDPGYADFDDDIREPVTAVRQLLDDVFGADIDVEIRTACRRLLHDIARGDPQIFRRKSSPARTAAAIAWMGAKANDLVGHGATVSTQDLLDAFGVKGSISQRAEPMQRAIGVDPHAQYSAMKLGTTRYLTSERRAAIIEARDLYEQRRAES